MAFVPGVSATTLALIASQTFTTRTISGASYRDCRVRARSTTVSDAMAAAYGARAGGCPAGRGSRRPEGRTSASFPDARRRRRFRGMPAVIEVAGLTKRYGRAVALDALDLVVEEGEVHGYLGPNGAGKSTTIRILLGLARASGGRARVLGGDPWRDAPRLHRRIASVPGDVALWPGLSGGETIDLLVRLRGGDTGSALYRRRRAELIEAFAFDPRKRARGY